jgi:dTDP-4-amino-4,6-dideoxygalactose transaminase
MDQNNKVKKFKKINPNEYGGLLYGYEELFEIQKLLLSRKIFRYASRKISPTDQFETSVKKYLDVKYALGFNNGTSALKAALFAAGVKQGDRVLISAYTFIATAAAVVSLGAIPIPIDFDFNFCMNLDDLKTEVAKGCKAIVPVHLQGRTFDVRPIINIAKENGVLVIEDSCQAFGSKFKGISAGCFGDIGVYSFQQYKQISAGEGGMMVTNNEKYYKIAKNYSDHGIIRELMTWDNDEAVIGDNYRMNNLQAVILKLQMKKIRGVIRDQIKNRKYILSRVAGDKLATLISSPDVVGETGMNLFFLLKSKDLADQAIAHARLKNIEIRKMWDRPYYLHGVFQKAKLEPIALKKSVCTIAEDIAPRFVSISIPPTLTEKNLKHMVKEIRELQKLKLIS